MSYQDTKTEECSRNFFKICSCQTDGTLSLGIMLERESSMPPPPESDSAAVELTATGTLQQLVFALWLDRVCKTRTAAKFDAMLKARLVLVLCSEFEDLRRLEPSTSFPEESMNQ